MVICMNETIDAKNVEALLEYKDLEEKDKDSLERMARKLKEGSKLTPNQSASLHKIQEKVGAKVEATRNLWSSGKIPMGKPVHLPYEDMPRPLRPPGKS